MCDVKLTVDDDVVWMPCLMYMRGPIVFNTHYHLIGQACNPGAEAHVKNAGKTINMGCYNTYDGVASKETEKCTGCWQDPNLLFCLDRNIDTIGLITGLRI